MKPDCKEIERQLSESRREFWAADATINNLEMKLTEMAAQLANKENECAALAAENAVLKESEREFDKMCAEEFGPDWVSEFTETPATDAFLAEVRAQGLALFAASLKVAGICEHPYLDAAIDLAAKLRQGVSSTMLHGSEPETDNTNQQFESLSRGDK